MYYIKNFFYLYINSPLFILLIPFSLVFLSSLEFNKDISKIIRLALIVINISRYLIKRRKIIIKRAKQAEFNILHTRYTQNSNLAYLNK